jgi:hypothetical protein
MQDSWFSQQDIFWDIKPCSLLKINRSFGETYRLYLQDRISRARNQRESRWRYIAEESALRGVMVSFFVRNIKLIIFSKC